jgi:hypothetical protein
MLDLLACIGLTLILKYGTILKRPRDYIKGIHPLLKDLFNCSLCLGFWSGVIVYCIVKSYILLPLASAGVCWAADAFIGILQFLEIKVEKDSKR